MGDWSNFGVGVAGAAANMGMNLVGNSVSGLINNLFYRRNLNLQVAAQKDLIDYQNAYNSPSAQMERLAEAGLNPNLVYGSQAPAGQSGNASAPSGVANPGMTFNTPDIVANALRAQQMENVEADVELKRANAEYLRTQNKWFGETAAQSIAESQVRMSKLASDMDVNQSSIQYQTALKALAVADEAYRRGQIGLQTYEQQVLIAQANLYRKDLAVKDAQIMDLKLSAALKALQFKYDQIMKSPLLAEEERKTRIQALKNQFAHDSSHYGIENSKAVAWTNQAFQWLGQAAGAATSIGLGFGGFGAGMKAFNSLGSYTPNSYFH